MTLHPGAPGWHACAKNGHCVHHVEGKGFLCCECPVRVHAPETGDRIFTSPSHGDIGTVTGRPWAMSFEIPATKTAQDEVRYFRKRMRWPWPCQNGCGQIAESPESYWCERGTEGGTCGQPESPHVDGAMEIEPDDPLPNNGRVYPKGLWGPGASS